MIKYGKKHDLIIIDHNLIINDHNFYDLIIPEKTVCNLNQTDFEFINHIFEHTNRLILTCIQLTQLSDHQVMHHWTACAWLKY